MKAEEKILLGAEQLFFKYGIKSVTMDDIAKHLGVSKKTIYACFKDKRQIVHDLMQQKLKEDERSISCSILESENVVEEVFKMIEHLSDIMSKVNPNVFYDLQKYYPKSWQLFQDFKQNCILKTVEDSIERGKKQGYVRKDVNSKVLSILRAIEIEMGFDQEVFPADKFSLLEVQLNLTEHFLYGICTLKGHKLINKFKKIVEEE